MKIKVTKKFIKKGSYSSTTSCPIALALKDADFSAISVDYKKITFDSSEKITQTIVPSKKLRRFMKRFDHGKKVKPFSFTLLELSEI